MGKQVNVDGPPGCGKTHYLEGTFVEAAKQFGPKKVGAITFTRSAAEELRQRMGATLGLGKDERVLRRELPWIGTIHAISLKLINYPNVVGWKDIKQFCKDTGQPEPKWGESDDLESRDSDEGSKSLVATMRDSLSAAKHKKLPLRVVVGDIVHPSMVNLYRPEVIEDLAERYEEFKHDKKLVDYEDMLEAGRHLDLPVSTLLVDEAQDCSPLMWDCADNWGAKADYYMAAGDAFQSIMSFTGGDPQLFIDHPGPWIRLTPSYRVSTSTAEYARDVLRAGGWHDLQNLWDGVGGEPVDGTTMYLARTNSLVRRVSSDLMEKGTPFYSLTKDDPWSSPTAGAYRMIRRLARGNMVQPSELLVLLNGAAWGTFGKAAKDRVESLSRSSSPMDMGDVERSLGIDLGNFSYRSWGIAQWMTKVEDLLGYPAIFTTPKTRVSTIHKAKGREADEVILIKDWGGIPGKNANTPGDKARSEACCAYVAVTRHRHKLRFMSLGASMEYPFPAYTDGEEEDGD